MPDKSLQGLRVVELGERIAAGACGSILATLGAEVTLVVPVATGSRHKWVDSALATAGKRTLHAAADADQVAALLDSADVVLLSTDVTAAPVLKPAQRRIVCDVTAYGSTGPLARMPHGDALVQAMSGLADTTGEAAAPPTLMPFPVAEGIAALYATAGVLAALRARIRDGQGQRVEIALFDCAFSTLTSFLPFHVIGKPVTRSGNRHVLAAPWNVYPTSDGWVVICTGTNDQWTRLCDVIGSPALALDARFRLPGDRVANCDAVDAAVRAWSTGRDTAACVSKLQELGISCGPIVTVDALASEPNLLHREMLTAVRDEQAGRDVAMLSPVIRATRARLSAMDAISPPRSAREAGGGPARPFDGIKVLEIGQFTTAPLVARHLAALGADVLKIESPSGDAARGWAPEQGGQGYFFTFSNSDKRSLSLDLNAEADRATFRALVADSDVLVENLKPGALAKLGLGAAQLHEINPRLVYCAICGFGADSAYPGRPAFDTVVQAMSGIMDLIRVDGVPQKAGISLADVLGGVYGLIATTAALIARESTARGAAIDISMQDAAAWITQWCWRTDRRAAASTIACSDGYVVAESMALSAAILAQASAKTRIECVALLAGQGLATAPVLSVSEAADSAQARERSLIVLASDAAGRRWPLLNCPIVLSGTPAAVRRPIGPLGEANHELQQNTDPARSRAAI